MSNVLTHPASKPATLPNGAKHTELQHKEETSSHIAVRPVYTPADLAEFDYDREVGYPGQFPYTRGVQATMYRGRLWTMRQYAGMGDAEESNKRYKYLLANGTTGLSVAFDLPTQIGLDSDNALAVGEVGKVGVAIDSIEDMQRLFDGIDLTKISTSMTINATASILLALYVAVARRQNMDIRKLSGTVQNDVLKEYIARGTYIYPPQQAMRIITDLFAWTNENVPDWNTISISGYHMREAGSTAVQEVAFTLGNGIAYVEAAIRAGLDVDKFAPRLSFFFNAHSNFLEEVAKFRAARRMWAKIMRDQFKAKNPKSWMLRFHTQTAGSTLTAQQPENNIVRTAIQAMAAVLGGTQSLHTNSFDEALALPTEASARIALRTQQIIAHESGAPQTVDPLAGSYYIESLTNEIEKDADRLSRKNRGHGRHVKSHRTRIRAAGDPERRLHLPAGRRSARGNRGRSQSLPHRPGARCSYPAHRPGAGAEAGRAPARRPGKTKSGNLASRHASRGRHGALRRQPDAAHPGRSRSQCHGWRNFGCDAEGVWGVQGSGGDLTFWLPQSCHP